MQNPSVLASRATLKTTRFEERDAKSTHAVRDAPSPHGRYRTPKELPRNAKNTGKTRVFERVDRNELLQVFPMFLTGSKGAQAEVSRCEADANGR